jgi:hypothetical protein
VGSTGAGQTGYIDTDLTYNPSTALLRVVQGATGGITGPILQIENINPNANPSVMNFYKNKAGATAGDGIGALAFTANNAGATAVQYARIQTDCRDSTTSSENGSISMLACVNSPTPTEFMRFNGLTNTTEMYKAIETRGNFLQNTTAGQSLTLYQSASGNITLNNVGIGGNINLTSSTGNISQTAATGTVNMAATAGSVYISGGFDTSISASTGTIRLIGNVTNGVKVVQPAGQRTHLRTSLIASNPIDFYPAVHIDNNNSNLTAIELPQVPYQELILLNMGVSPVSAWNNFGSAFGNCDAMYYAGSGYVWLGIGSTIYVVNSAFNTTIQTIPLAGSSSGPGTTRANCFHEYGGYMFIGGDFTFVNNNFSQPQYGLTRIKLSGGSGSYADDPIYETGSSYGVNGVVESLSELAGNLYVGGSFTGTFAGGSSAANYIFRVESHTASGGSQTYTINTNLDANAPVYALWSTGSLLIVGGSFTALEFGAYSYNYCATYSGSSWSTVDTNQFNGSVYALYVSSTSSYVLAGGTFSHNGFSNICYLDAATPANSATNAGISPSSIGKLGIHSGSGRDVVQSTGGDVYLSTSFTIWSSLGQSIGATQPSAIIFISEPIVSYYSYTYVRRYTTSTQAAKFSLPSASFYYAGNTYTNATLNQPYTSQLFVATPGVNYWVPVGSPIVVFS